MAKKKARKKDKKPLEKADRKSLRYDRKKEEERDLAKRKIRAQKRKKKLKYEIALIVVLIGIFVLMSFWLKNRKKANQIKKYKAMMAARYDEESAYYKNLKYVNDNYIYLEDAKNKMVDRNKVSRKYRYDKAIEKYLTDNKLDKENMTFSYYDFKKNTYYFYNEKKMFYAASTVKVPIAMAITDMVNEGALDWSDPVQYVSGFYEGGTGLIQNDPVGTSYTLEKLVELSIRESDNIATNLLIDVINRTSGRFFRDLIKEKYDVFIDEENMINAEDSLKAVVYLEKNKSNYPKLIDNMKNTVHDNLYVRLIKDKSEIAHKVGLYDPIFGDIGIVYGANPYAFAMFTNYVNDDGTGNDKAIGDIAEIIDQIHNEYN